jgi:hypothetical protein
MKSERERLIDDICAKARLVGADRQWGRWLDFVSRLRKTSLGTLRAIVDLDLVTVTAREMGVRL